MASDLDNAIARRSAIWAEIAALDSTKAGGLPDVTGAGLAVQHQLYKKGLYEELAQIEERISILSGPWENVTRGITG